MVIGLVCKCVCYYLLSVSALIPLRWSLPEPRAHCVLWLGWQPANPGDHLVLLPMEIEAHVAIPSFFREKNDSDESNSDPHACTASVLTHLVISPAGGMVFLTAETYFGRF